MKKFALNLDEIDALGELLASIPEPFVPMEADMLDGFLSALSLMKHPPMIDQWIGFVFDMNGHPNAHLARHDEHSLLRSLILKRGKEIEYCLLNQKPIDPIIYDEDQEDPLMALTPFADGFAFACSLWPELMHYKDRAIQAALVGVLRYASSDEEDTETTNLIQTIEDEIRFASLEEALTDLTACLQEIAEVTRR